MWRLPGLLGRALHRFHAANVPSSLHPTPAAPHPEVEALNPLLPFGPSPSQKRFHSSNSQNGQNGNDQRQERTFRPFSNQLPQYSALDAFGWGAVAAVFLHLSKQIPSRDSAPNCNRKSGCSWPTYLDNLLASVLHRQGPSQRCQILPNEDRGIYLGAHQTAGAERSFDSSTGSSRRSASSPGQGPDLVSSEGEESSDITSESSSSSTSEAEPGGAWAAADTNEDVGPAGSLEDAACRLQDVSQNSAATVLNIIGIGSARDSGDYSTAFSCFQTAASRGYSKAQYNTGVCYEQGNGVAKDLEKAAVYYHLAASNGHRMAQYRYARYLLHNRAGLGAADQQKALEMLEQAAEAGLKEAQAYLGVFYTKDPHLDPQKAVKYIKQAAENGDARSQYHLGLCYESGFGVPLNLSEAIKHYEQAASTGNEAAQDKLASIYQKQLEDLMQRRPCHLKAASSSPCLASLDRIAAQFPCSGLHIPTHPLDPASGALHLPHSWSTGCLSALVDQVPAYSEGTESRLRLAPLPIAALRAIGVG